MKTYSVKYSVTTTHTIELKKKPTEKQLETLRRISGGEILDVHAEFSDLIHLELDLKCWSESIFPEKYHWFEFYEGDKKTLTYKA